MNAVALYDGAGESHAGLPRRCPHRREQVLRQRCPPRKASNKATSHRGCGGGLGEGCRGGASPGCAAHATCAARHRCSTRSLPAPFPRIPAFNSWTAQRIFRNQVFSSNW